MFIAKLKCISVHNTSRTTFTADILRVDAVLSELNNMLHFLLEMNFQIMERTTYTTSVERVAAEVYN